MLCGIDNITWNILPYLTFGNILYNIVSPLDIDMGVNNVVSLGMNSS